MTCEIVYKDMPSKIKVITKRVKKNYYVLIINKQIDDDKKREALIHGMDHINNEEFSKSLKADEIEAQYLEEIIWLVL